MSRLLCHSLLSWILVIMPIALSLDSVTADTIDVWIGTGDSPSAREFITVPLIVNKGDCLNRR